MKVAVIIHNVSETDTIDKLIEKYGIKNFTRIDKAVGKSELADPLFDNKIWPGYYSITMIEDTENQIEKIREEVKNIKENLKIPDLKYYEIEVGNFI